MPGFDVYHDPVPILERVRQPVLAIYGAADASVPPRTSAEIVQAALKGGGNRAVTLMIFPQADHILMVEGQGESHTAPGFLDAMTAWVHGLTRGDTTFTAPVQTLRPSDLPPEIVGDGRPGWFGSFPVQLVLLVSFVMVFLSPLCLWPIGFLVRRLRRRPRATGNALLTAGVVLLSVLNLVLLAGWVQLLGGHVSFLVNAKFVEQRGLWQVIVGLALLSLILAFGLAVTARRTIMRRKGSRSWRLHTAFVIGGGLVFVAFLGYWHLLGI